MQDRDSACPTASGDAFSTSWGWIGSLIIYFVIFVIIFYLVYLSLAPPFVLDSNTNEVDNAKVLLSSVISSLIIIVVVWLIRVVTRKVTNKIENVA